MGEHPGAVTYEPIGVVRSPYTTLDGMPLQTGGWDDVDATVELDARVHGALRDLDGFWQSGCSCISTASTAGPPR